MCNCAFHQNHNYTKPHLRMSRGVHLSPWFSEPVRRESRQGDPRWRSRPAHRNRAGRGPLVLALIRRRRGRLGSNATGCPIRPAAQAPWFLVGTRASGCRARRRSRGGGSRLTSPLQSRCHITDIGRSSRRLGIVQMGICVFACLRRSTIATGAAVTSGKVRYWADICGLRGDAFVSEAPWCE